jgi:hypothetical protein
MALSMEEQRILAEIEQHLAKAEPALAARLRAFGRPGLAGRLRSPRLRFLASFTLLMTVTVVTVVVYVMLPLRALPDRGGSGRPTTAPRHPSMSAPQQPTPGRHAGSPATAPSRLASPSK